ncbi:MAG: alpha/beta fold hydrolase [Planctomycetia bacterium]|nr:alpha/beta fold hydrolase [Planctomycetia bacterium]
MILALVFVIVLELLCLPFVLVVVVVLVLVLDGAVTRGRRRCRMQRIVPPTLLLVLLILFSEPASIPAADPPPKIHLLQTPAGIKFGLVGEQGGKPAPTLFIFANDIKTTLGNEAYAKAGRILAKEGCLSVALDLPCHGEDRREGEPAGLDGWQRRIDKGDPVIPAFVERCSAVLDHLVQEGYTDDNRVAACGTSRGGFIALHFAAAEPRIKCVAAFAPVTDLALLREFADCKSEGVPKLALAASAEKFAGRPVWITIGNDDQRVGTDAAIKLTRAIVESSRAAKKPPLVELHVSTAAGHRTHPTAHDEAAAWIGGQLKTK